MRTEGTHSQVIGLLVDSLRTLDTTWRHRRLRRSGRRDKRGQFGSHVPLGNPAWSDQSEGLTESVSVFRLLTTVEDE